MADSDSSLQRDDRHHRRSRSRSPVSPDWAGETPAEREERRLAEVAVLVGPSAGRPRAGSAHTGLLTQEPELAEVTAPTTPTASPAAPPREGAPDARGAETAAPASHAAAPIASPGTPPTQGGSSSAGTGRIAEGCGSGRGEAGRAHAGLRPRPREAAPPSQPATPRPPARPESGGRTPHGPQAPRRRPPRQQQRAKRARSTTPTPAPPTPTPAPLSHSPPSPSPRGGRSTSAHRRPSARRRASRCRSCKGSGTPGV